MQETQREKKFVIRQRHRIWNMIQNFTVIYLASKCMFPRNFVYSRERNAQRERMMNINQINKKKNKIE